MANTNPALQAVPLPSTPKKRFSAEPVTYKAGAYFLCALGLVLAAFAVWNLREAQSAASAPAADVKKLDSELERHKDDDAKFRQQVRADVHEVQLDVRALYRTIHTGRRQDRLEREPPAPGPLAEPGPP